MAKTDTITKKNPQKQHHLALVSKKITGGLKLVSQYCKSGNFRENSFLQKAFENTRVRLTIRNLGMTYLHQKSTV